MFENTKFRASSWGNLLTEPRTKSEGALSITCQKELIKIYNREMYGRVKDITTKQMDKGIQQEPESIKLLSKVEGQFFYKNENNLENEYFTGTPDLFLLNEENQVDECYDIKTSWEIDSFMPKLIEAPDKGYEAQLNCYYDLTGADSGALVYCLVSAPINIVESEKKALLWRMNVVSEIAPEYLKASSELEKLLIYDDIDYRERVIIQKVPRNEELIQKMKDKVPVLREWLQNFHTKHMNLYPKTEKSI